MFAVVCVWFLFAYLLYTHIFIHLAKALNAFICTQSVCVAYTTPLQSLLDNFRALIRTFKFKAYKYEIHTHGNVCGTNNHLFRFPSLFFCLRHVAREYVKWHVEVGTQSVRIQLERLPNGKLIFVVI